MIERLPQQPADKNSGVVEAAAMLALHTDEIFEAAAANSPATAFYASTPEVTPVLPPIPEIGQAAFFTEEEVEAMPHTAETSEEAMDRYYAAIAAVRERQKQRTDSAA